MPRFGVVHNFCSGAWYCFFGPLIRIAVKQNILVFFVLTVQAHLVLGLVCCRRFISMIKTAVLLAVASETEIRQSLFRNLPTDFCHQKSKLGSRAFTLFLSCASDS